MRYHIDIISIDYRCQTLSIKGYRDIDIDCAQALEMAKWAARPIDIGADQRYQ